MKPRSHKSKDPKKVILKDKVKSVDTIDLFGSADHQSEQQVDCIKITTEVSSVVNPYDENNHHFNKQTEGSTDQDDHLHDSGKDENEVITPKRVESVINDSTDGSVNIISKGEAIKDDICPLKPLKLCTHFNDEENNLEKSNVHHINGKEEIYEEHIIQDQYYSFTEFRLKPRNEDIKYKNVTFDAHIHENYENDDFEDDDPYPVHKDGFLRENEQNDIKLAAKKARIISMVKYWIGSFHINLKKANLIWIKIVQNEFMFGYDISKLSDTSTNASVNVDFKLGGNLRFFSCDCIFDDKITFAIINNTVIISHNNTVEARDIHHEVGRMNKYLDINVKSYGDHLDQYDMRGARDEFVFLINCYDSMENMKIQGMTVGLRRVTPSNYNCNINLDDHIEQFCIFDITFGVDGCFHTHADNCSICFGITHSRSITTRTYLALNELFEQITPTTGLVIYYTNWQNKCMTSLYEEPMLVHPNHDKIAQQSMLNVTPTPCKINMLFHNCCQYRVQDDGQGMWTKLGIFDLLNFEFEDSSSNAGFRTSTSVGKYGRSDCCIMPTSLNEDLLSQNSIRSVCRHGKLISEDDVHSLSCQPEPYCSVIIMSLSSCNYSPSPSAESTHMHNHFIGLLPTFVVPGSMYATLSNFCHEVQF